MLGFVASPQRTIPHLALTALPAAPKTCPRFAFLNLFPVPKLQLGNPAQEALGGCPRIAKSVIFK